MTPSMSMPERAQKGSLAIPRGTYVTCCLPTGSWFFGKFNSSDGGEVCIDDVIGQVLGEKGAEYRVRPGTSIYLRESIIAIMPSSEEEAQRLIHPMSPYAMNLGKYVAVKVAGDTLFGRLAELNLSAAHLLPYMAYRQLGSGSEAFIEEARPAVIKEDSINAMFPITEQDLVNRVEHYNKWQVPIDGIQREIHSYELSQRRAQIVKEMEAVKQAHEQSEASASAP